MSRNPHATLRRRLLLAGVGLVLGATGAQAGNLDAPAAPNEAGSAMSTLDSLYNRLDTGVTGSKRGATFAEPTSGPSAGTMHNLDAIMNKMPVVDDANGASVADVAKDKTFWGLTSVGWGLRTGTLEAGGGASAAVPKTGQTICYNASGSTVIACSGTGQDGALQQGVNWPNPRFTDNANGTVTDNLTGLIWLKNANCFWGRSWRTALNDANTLASPACGLSDGSTAGQWRLPNIKELQSLVHYGVFDPALPNTAGTGKWTANDPFSGVRSNWYWSSTSYAGLTNYAWFMDLSVGTVRGTDRALSIDVWPVRGGQ